MLRPYLRVTLDGKGNGALCQCLLNWTTCAHSAEAEGLHLAINSYVGSGQSLSGMNGILKSSYCKIPLNPSQ